MTKQPIVRAILLACTGMACLLSVTGCAPQRPTGRTVQVAVIVHPSNGIESLSTHELRRIFSKRETRWKASGLAQASILAIDLDAEDPARAVFSDAVFGMSIDAVRQFWIAERLKSGHKPPPQRSASQVLSIVGRVPNAIGYVPAHMASKKVKVVRTF